MNPDDPSSGTDQRLLHNGISFTGIIVALGGVFSFLLLTAFDVVSGNSNPYVGILAYVIAPAFVFLGLGLTLWGGWRTYRRIRRENPGAVPSLRIAIDLTQVRGRKTLMYSAAGLVGFLFLSAIGSYQTYHYTESVNFCGQACHEPMHPQFEAYLHSPHAEVSCTECHIGSGAEHYLKAKLNGVRQLYHTFKGDFQRPITMSVKDLRPAAETCGECHWSGRNAGTKEKFYTHFLADETNTFFGVRLLLNIGGPETRGDLAGGIHWHMNEANKVEYIAMDDHQSEIPWVRVTNEEGEVTEFRSYGFEDDIADHEILTMDCLDCHNRPAHRFETPNDLVDKALYSGRINASLPWVKSNVVHVLTRDYETPDDAMNQIAAYLGETYSGEAEVDRLIVETTRIYEQNFFPTMKADWRAHPDQISHKDTNGCFRCHDGMHESDDGRTLSASDCNSCHTILAQGTWEELENLSSEGHEFFHIDSIYEDFSCADCHTGALMEDEEFDEDLAFDTEQSIQRHITDAL